MTCPGCGAWIPEDAGFCRGCGTIVRGPRGFQVKPAQPAGPAVGTRRGSRGNRPPDTPALRYAPPSPVGYGIDAPPPAAGYPPPPPPPPPPPASGAQALGTSVPAYAGAPAPPPPPAYPPAYPSTGYPPAYPSTGYPPAYGAQEYWAGGGYPPGAVWAARGRSRGLVLHHTGADFLAFIFTAVSLASLFLPWYQVRWADSVGDSINLGQTSALGSGAGGWRFAILATAGLVIAYLVARVVMTFRWPPNLPHFPVLLLLTLGNLALVVVAFFQLPAGGASVTSEGVTFGITQYWGAYLGLVTAILAAVAAISNMPRGSRTR